MNVVKCEKFTGQWIFHIRSTIVCPVVFRSSPFHFLLSTFSSSAHSVSPCEPFPMVLQRVQELNGWTPKMCYMSGFLQNHHAPGGDLIHCRPTGWARSSLSIDLARP